MFHRALPARIVQNQDELDDLGDEWSKTIFTADDEPEPAPPEMVAPENGASTRRRGRPPKA